MLLAGQGDESVVEAFLRPSRGLFDRLIFYLIVFSSSDFRLRCGFSSFVRWGGGAVWAGQTGWLAALSFGFESNRTSLGKGGTFA